MVKNLFDQLKIHTPRSSLASNPATGMVENGVKEVQLPEFKAVELTNPPTLNPAPIQPIPPTIQPARSAATEKAGRVHPSLPLSTSPPPNVPAQPVAKRTGSVPPSYAVRTVKPVGQSRIEAFKPVPPVPPVVPKSAPSSEEKSQSSIPLSTTPKESEADSVPDQVAPVMHSNSPVKEEAGSLAEEAAFADSGSFDDPVMRDSVSASDPLILVEQPVPVVQSELAVDELVMVDRSDDPVVLAPAVADGELSSSPHSTVSEPLVASLVSLESAVPTGNVQMEPQGDPGVGEELLVAPAHPTPGQSLSRKGKLINWSTVWLSVTGTFGGVTVLALIWLTSLPPLPDCQKVSTLSAEIDRLYCAQALADSGEVEELLAAIALVSPWEAEQPFYREAQDLQQEWAGQILRQAHEKVKQSDLQGGIDLANRIPKTNPLYAEAQADITAWQDEWQRGETIYAEAQTAMRERQWGLASALVLDLGNLDYDYWRKDRSNQLTQKVLEEKAAWQTLKRAQILAKANSPEKLAEAIALVQQVNPNSYVWEEAKAELNKWGEALVKIGMRRWKQGDLAGTIAVVRVIPPDLLSEPILHDVQVYSAAQELATQTQEPWEVAPGEVFRLMEAIAAVRQIQPDSPLYEKAQANLQDWQAQLQDLTQLQFANLTASTGQRFAFNLAIQQAAQVNPDRPRRMQAQTLIAHWRQQIQRIEDYPYLLQAQTIAQSGKIADLQAAIALLSQLPKDRALWSEAEVTIGSWTDQIETIEDKPILQKAQTLAEKGQLRAAIDLAETIERNRALYRQAQAAVDIWQNKLEEIQIAEDRPILDEAYSLAKTERYTLAIEAASRIGRDRALYDEAQAAIAQWDSARDALQAEWEAEAAEDAYVEDVDPDSYSDEGYYESDPSYSEESY